MTPSSPDIWLLMARTLSGEATAEEQTAFDNHLQQDAQLRFQYQVLKESWHQPEQVGSENVSAEESGQIARILQLAETEQARLSPVPPEPESRKPSRRFRTILYTTVAAAAAIIAFIIFYHPSSKMILPVPPVAVQQVSVPSGTHRKITLPDGSTVWLNAGSSISYPAVTDPVLREVTLKGEAFFDVVKMKGRPFIVHASGIDIRVLGTAFNVRSYQGEKTVETTLIRGLVQVTRQGIKDEVPVMLYPHQKLVMELKARSQPEETAELPAVKQMYIAAVDSSKAEDKLIETAWLYNRLEFRKTDFEELATRMERWYNIRITFKNENLKRLRFNGSFKDETPAEAFSALQKIAPFTFKIKDNEVLIDSPE